MSIEPARRANRPLTLPRRAPLSLEKMSAALRESGLNIPTRLNARLDGMRTRALNTLDLRGEGTAFEHIQRIARAEKLRDGSASAALAEDLFQLVGTARLAGHGTRCYGRTTHTIFTLHHPGEFTRILADLAVNGAVALGNGERVQWDPASTPIGVGAHADYLWGSLNQLIRARELPSPARLPLLSPQPRTEDLAYQGQMANIYTRFFGKPHVNVNGQLALPHLNEIVARTGPLLGEYGAHGGSVAVVSPQNVPLGVEGGQLEPQAHGAAHGGTCPNNCQLGYVVMPTDEVARYKLQPIEYPESDRSYTR